MRVIKPLINVKVLGTGLAVPESCKFTNLDIIKLHPSTKILPEFAQKKLASMIQKKYGFDIRYMTHEPGSRTSIHDEISAQDISVKSLLEAYNVKYGDIDFFVHGTTTSGRYTGSQSTSLLAKIEQYSPALEVKAGCSTSLASLYTGILGICSGHKNVMVLCTETMSKLVNPNIRETWFGLADGSAALWLEQTEQASGDFKILGMCYGTNGKYVDMYTTQGSLPPNQYDLENHGYVLSGNGDRLRDLSIEHYKKMYQVFRESFDMSTITHLIPHQVNNSIINEVVKKYFIDSHINIVKNNMDIGNIGGASILYSLSDNIQKNSFKKGDRILMMSVGGGLSYSMHLWEKL